MGSYYTKAFAKLKEAGVPNWYIRLYVLADMSNVSYVEIYRDVYNVNASYGWYTTYNTLGIDQYVTLADINRKCYGVLVNLGFPTWQEYNTLFDGNEYDNRADFRIAYDNHREDWLKMQAKNPSIAYD